MSRSTSPGREQQARGGERVARGDRARDCRVDDVQLVLVIRGSSVLVVPENLVAPLAERVLRFFSYFTIQSNLLAAGTALSLIARPDRDGRTWRVMRVAAIVGMTVTFIVYMIVLRPIVHLTGIAKLTDIGFHYVAPVLTVAGWLFFGPWPRIDVESLVRHLAWPVSYLIYILVLGAVTGWYPYPFINVSRARLSARVVECARRHRASTTGRRRMSRDRHAVGRSQGGAAGVNRRLRAIRAAAFST